MSMDIDLSNVSEGRSYEFSYALDVGGLVGERLVVFSEPTRVEGSYIKTGGDLVVKARIFVSAVFNCDRCLTEVKREYSTQANAVFKDAAREFDDFVYKEAVKSDDRVYKKTGKSEQANAVFNEAVKSERANAVFKDAGKFDDYVYEGTTVCLDEMFRERFILSFPEYVVCRPDCKGLCAVCGCDLNTNQCNCQENQNGDGGGNSFAALKDIAPGGKNGGTKKKNI